MGGTWMAIVFGFAGVRIKPDHLSLSPKLPADWGHYQFKLQYKGCTLQVKVDKENIQLTLLEGEQLTVMLGGQTITLNEQEAYKLPYSQAV
jgi:alpha,alpha-trehalose phosphorylase